MNDLNSKTQKLCRLLNIELPIIQAGMVWVSGGKLAAAAANSGCLGLIGAGSMHPELLEQHIQKAQALIKKQKALGVNIPLLYDRVEEQIDVALKNNIRTFFTSAGSPKKWTQKLKNAGCVVFHVTSSAALAKKCEDAGVDGIVAEGFEAGGHNGRDELTTMTLIPQVVDAVNIPVIAAGGIGDGRSMAAAFCLGASAVQMGTRFMMTQESSAHQNYKNLLQQSGPEATMLTMKDLIPVRLIKNKFFEKVQALEEKCASKDELQKLLGKGRAKLGMLEGELDEGELEVGQVCGSLKDLPTVEQMVHHLLKEYKNVLANLS